MGNVVIMTVHSNDGLFTELLDGRIGEFIIKESLVGGRQNSGRYRLQGTVYG